MTVKEFIEKLQEIEKINPNAKVYISSGCYVNELDEKSVSYDCYADAVLKI